MNGRNWTIAALLVFLVVALSACNAVIGSGDIVTEKRDVSGFDNVSLAGSGDAIITQGEGESLTIETYDNIMPYVTSEVRDGTLFLGVEDQTNIIPRRLVFTVGVDELGTTNLAGSGSIEAGDIETDSLEIVVGGSGSVKVDSLTAGELSARIAGSGSVEVAGEVPEQNVRISGSGKYQAGDLRAEETVIEISGSGKATVWTTGSLDADISGSGSIDYYGNPTVNSSSSGSGDLDSLGEK